MCCKVLGHAFNITFPTDNPVRKALPVLAALYLITFNVHAQGTIRFANDAATAVTNSLTGQRLIAGSGYSAVLYYAPDGITNESSLVLVTNRGVQVYSFFSQAGIFDGGTVTTPTNTAPGEFAMLQVRVWSGPFRYEDVIASSRDLVGKSQIIRVQTGVAGSTPPGSMAASGLNGFSLLQAGTSVDDPVVFEGNSLLTNALFTVRLARESSLPVSVSFATSDGTATAGVDYLPVNGALVFLPGELEKSIAVPVLGDHSFELSETFVLNLLERTNTFLTKAQGTAQIRTDEPFLTINDVSIVEGNNASTSAVFVVQLSEPLVDSLLVQFSTESGLATAGTDFLATKGRLVFMAGETTKTFAVEILGDVLQEPRETFSVLVSGEAGATIQELRARVAIVDDDPLPPELDHFGFSFIPSPQYQHLPFGLMVTALDATNGRVSRFNGVVQLTGIEGPRNLDLGTDQRTGAYLLYTGRPVQRQQVIYLSDELPPALTINALALEVTQVPGPTLSNWTIRLKQTPWRRYEMPILETNGWTTVYRSNQTITSTGWVTFGFSAPFKFDGSSNLLVDFSFNNQNGVPIYQGSCRYSSTADLTVERYSFGGDPLLWAGTNLPDARIRSDRPNIRLNVNVSMDVAPAGSGQAQGGEWVGLLAAQQAASSIRLRAQDHGGHQGITNPFVVESSIDADQDGLPDPWELGFYESLLPLPQDDPDVDGLTNQQELLAGTHPRNADSNVRITSLEQSSGQIAIEFMSVAAKLYQLEQSNGMEQGNAWSAIGGLILGTGQGLHLSVPTIQSQHAFYRLRLAH